MWLSKLSPDKVLHFAAGAVLAAAGACTALAGGASPVFAAAAAVWLAAMAGAAKEVFDGHENRRIKRPAHEVSVVDFLATAAGSLPVALPVLATLLKGQSWAF